MKNKVLVIIIVIFSVLMFSAPFIAGRNPRTPQVLKGTYASETISLTFSGWDKVVAEYGEVKAEGTYTNGTTGTQLVIWMDFGENCPEEFQFLLGDRINYHRYSIGENYLEIDDIKYYKQ